MNTLAHIVALITLLWFSIYAFDTMGETALGVAVLGMFLVFIPLTLLALKDDADILSRGGDDE